MKIKLIIVTALAVMVAGCFQPDFNKVTIKDVVSDVKSNLVGFNTDNVSDIGGAIKGNINALDRLIKYINDSKDYEKAFPEIVKTVDKLAANYKHIADKRDAIKKTLQNRINKVKKQRELAAGKINFCKQKIGVTESQLASESVEYRKTALKMTLKFEKQELTVWQKFSEGMQFNELITRLDAASNGINQFVDILSSNSMVYTQASLTLHAISDYRNAKQDLQEVLAVVNLGDDLVESWSKLSIVIDSTMAHIDELEVINFDAPTTEGTK